VTAQPGAAQSSPAQPDPAQPDPAEPEQVSPGSAVDGLSYEQARDALAEVVRRLEAGGVALEDSLALWERGERLAELCQAWLDGARQRLAAAAAEAGADGGGRGTPF